ncbi:MAG: hypothetical protein AMJ55_05915 [Gammaproteobacteria bacterium SG8_15]|nr:MAG: hypothetical protein AMJ55_05915 [Gammaproteobacteria bacterium SG8_15]
MTAGAWLAAQDTVIHRRRGRGCFEPTGGMTNITRVEYWNMIRRNAYREYAVMALIALLG